MTRINYKSKLVLLLIIFCISAISEGQSHDDSNAIDKKMPSPPPHKSEATNSQNNPGLITNFSVGATQVMGVNQSRFEVVYPDPNLEAAIRAAINKPEGPIYFKDLDGLKRLPAGNKGIKDIEGLEYCTKLESLFLDTNQITDISQLSGLTNLKELQLDFNQITDVSPLSGLTSLESLGLQINRITDVSPLSGLTKLENLYLDVNQITDVSPLSGLTNLKYLSVAHNQITDVSPLSGLTKLEILHLDTNKITDVSPLSGLTNLKYLSLMDNPISDVSPLLRLKNLKELYSGEYFAMQSSVQHS